MILVVSNCLSNLINCICYVKHYALFFTDSGVILLLRDMIFFFQGFLYFQTSEICIVFFLSRGGGVTA